MSGPGTTRTSSLRGQKSALDRSVLQNSSMARDASLGASARRGLLALPPSLWSPAAVALRLRNAGDWRSRGWSLDVLGELSQVLGGGDEQNLVAGTAQAPQPEPVQLQDALHVRKQHLDFLALAARLLEGLGVGQGADAVAHRLVDVSGDFAHRPGRALGLQRAG